MHLGRVAHTCNPRYSGDGDQEDESSWPAQAKSLQYLISTNGWAQWHAPVTSAMQGNMNRMIMVQTHPGTKWDPISKITNLKRAGVQLKW
jgi:hypothetical protein